VAVALRGVAFAVAGGVEAAVVGVAADCTACGSAAFSLLRPEAGRTVLGAWLTVGVEGADARALETTGAGCCWATVVAPGIGPGSIKLSDSMVRTKSSRSSLLAAMKENVMAYPRWIVQMSV